MGTKEGMIEPTRIMPNIGDVMSISYSRNVNEGPAFDASGELSNWRVEQVPDGWEATVTLRLRQPDAFAPIESAVLRNLRPLLNPLRGCPVAFETAEDLPIIADWLDDAGDERGPLVRAIGHLATRKEGEYFGALETLTRPRIPVEA